LWYAADLMAVGRDDNAKNKTGGSHLAAAGFYFQCRQSFFIRWIKYSILGTIGTFFTIPSQE
jgi:hypothetical protein